ncbi:MAG: DNA alkylation repair protein [Blastocatellia bacterium]|nr:DNA alkylation repair protein [Blastocatellia bacterium]
MTTLKQSESKEIEKLATEIDARLRALSNTNAESVRTLRREFSNRLSETGPQTIIELASRLLDWPGPEYRLVAYELVHHHRAALRSIGAKDLERLGWGIDSWGAVDTFACYLAGPAWRENQVTDNLIHRWARSTDRWWRRAALVSTVALNSKARGGAGDASRTLEVCRLLVGDKDDMVVKALSWALRELAKRDPEAARDFLAEYEIALAARVVREVRNKLSTGLKNPRR